MAEPQTSENTTQQKQAVVQPTVQAPVTEQESASVSQVQEARPIFCGQCGTKNNAGAAFCGNCGSKLVR